MILTALLRFRPGPPTLMPAKPLLTALAVALIACACAQLSEDRANIAGNRYLACVNAAADRRIGNVAGAEDIATAAHGECWSDWKAYRDETETSFLSRARTAEEAQLAHDKADAHLRQFEFESRRAIMSRVVQRTYGVPGTAR